MQLWEARYGSEAAATLGELVAKAKTNRPLAPVTIVVRDNIAAITTRRALAAGIGGRKGVAAINVTTLRRVADHLLSLAGRTLPPVTSARLTALWRTELGVDPGIFAPVATHPATVRALSRAYRELRGLDASALTAVAASGGLGAAVARLHSRVTERATTGYRDETSVLRDAAALVDSHPATAGQLGPVVVFLPDEPTPIELEFIRALDAAREVQVVVGATGDAAVDGALAGKFGGGTTATETTPAQASRIIHASDADDEVRAIVREIVALLATGTPAHRIAALYPKNVPYARLLHDHLATAGIATNGPGVRPMRDRAIADGFLALLALDPVDLQRVAVFDWLGRAPVRTADGSSVPRTGWERLSREAGITGGDWTERLEEHRISQQSRLDASRGSSDASPGSIDYLERQIADVHRFSGFIAELTATLHQGREVRGWTGIGEWALATFRRYYGSADAHTRLPEPEQRAATAIETTLRGLGELEGIGDVPTLDEVVEILEVDLDQRRPRVGRFGDGVFVGPVSAAASLAVTDVFVLGLSEDLYPGRQSADPLLSDAVRAATGGALETSRDRLRAQHRSLLAAFAAAPRVTASFPRGDLRRGAERLPSRWLMPTLRSLSGMPELEATRWFEAASPQLTSVESHWRGIARGERPSTEQEWRLRHATGGGRLDDEVVDAAAAITSARLSADFTRFDGNLEHIENLPDYADGARLISPTALERYASCPHTFFVERVLDVSAIEAPEDIVNIRAMDIGNIVHQVMERLAEDFTGSLPGYGEPWSAQQRARMREIADEVMGSFERRGLTGHPRLWARERELLRADLEFLLDEDDRVRRERDARVVASELRFGMDGTAPVLVDVDGGAVAMRGSADRVDETRDGTLVVTDFKTGSSRKFDGIQDDPLVGGTKLQLPLYAHAARAAFGNDRIEAGYWFVGRKNRGKRIDVALDDDLEARYSQALGTLVRGIREGRFIARPPAADDFAWVWCEYCNPDGVGYGHVREASRRKTTDAALADLFALLDPSVLAETEDSE